MGAIDLPGFPQHFGSDFQKSFNADIRGDSEDVVLMVSKNGVIQELLGSDRISSLAHQIYSRELQVADFVTVTASRGITASFNSVALDTTGQSILYLSTGDGAQVLFTANGLGASPSKAAILGISVESEFDINCSTFFRFSNDSGTTQRARLINGLIVGTTTTDPGAGCILAGDTITATSKFRVGTAAFISTLIFQILPASGDARFGCAIPANTNYAQFGFFNESGNQRGFFGYVGSNAVAAARFDHFEIGSTSGTSIYFRPGDNINSLGGDVVMDSNGLFSVYDKEATQGKGIPVIKKYDHQAGISGVAATGATYTPAAAGAFLVSVNVLVTTPGSANFTCECTYTDEGGTARTMTMILALVGATVTKQVLAATGAVPYASAVYHIRVKGGVAITLQTQAAGTYTGCTYNFCSTIKQIS